jgi:penicillin G amidase
MRRLLILLSIATTTLVIAAFAHEPESFDALARASLSRLDGTVTLPGLKAPVEVIRDKWGVPHIYAQNTSDLFFAQGYVQAQDRLWQMDLYRRTHQGRLSEVLGPAAIPHDRLTRLLHYRGPFDDREYTTYHPEARHILQRFADGVNAYIAYAGDNLPVEFKLTGLRPGRWTADIALIRTQTALPLGDARAELTMAMRVALLGVDEAQRRARQTPRRPLVVPEGLDPTVIDSAVLAALGGQVATVRPALLPKYRKWLDALPRHNAGAVERSPGSNNWVVSGRRTATGKVLLANDPHRSVGNPSIRYIVHLNAPGWNVIGATEPVFPGVMIGHNGRIGWGLTVTNTDQSDVYVETLNPANREQVLFDGRWENLRQRWDTIRVRGRSPVIVRQRFSRHGPVFYIDSVRNVAYSIRTTALEPGTAGYLAALRFAALDDCRQFLDAQKFYLAPGENNICGDTAGNIAWQAAALTPRRTGWDGRLPVPGTGRYEWSGFRDDLPRELNPDRGWIATANHDIHPPGYDPPLFFISEAANGRYKRIESLLTNGSGFTISDFERLQHDSFLIGTDTALARFRNWKSSDPGTERARVMLAEWDGFQRRESAAAALYHYVKRALDDSSQADRTIEAAVRRGLASLRAAQGNDPAQWSYGRIFRSEFPHLLARAYDLPAIERSGGAGTVAAVGATYRQVIDFSNLDNSVATNAPGQSGQPGSPYYGNLIQSFGAQSYFPLAFSRGAVESHARHRLVLLPGKHR